MPARTPALTPLRAAHHFFTHYDRSHTDATRVVFVNNGGRSHLVHVQGDGGFVPLAPTMHQHIDKDVTAAAHTYARAVHGPRRNWPTHVTIIRPRQPLTPDDAAPHLGDHVLNNRVYTFNPAADTCARRALDYRRQMLHNPAAGPDYRHAITLMAHYLRVDHLDPRHLFFLARSYVRAHPN